MRHYGATDGPGPGALSVFEIEHTGQSYERQPQLTRFKVIYRLLLLPSFTAVEFLTTGVWVEEGGGGGFRTM